MGGKLILFENVSVKAAEMNNSIWEKTGMAYGRRGGWRFKTFLNSDWGFLCLMLEDWIGDVSDDVVHFMFVIKVCECYYIAWREMFQLLIADDQLSRQYFWSTSSLGLTAEPVKSFVIIMLRDEPYFFDVLIGSVHIDFIPFFPVLMLEHQKDTVSCVASGKEQHISMEDIYEMSQTKNKRYRWKHAFQCKLFLCQIFFVISFFSMDIRNPSKFTFQVVFPVPSLCQTDPNCLRYLKDSAAGEGEEYVYLR